MAPIKFAKLMRAGEPIEIYNHGDMRRDFTYIDDIVRGFVAAVEKPLGYEIINLGRGEPVKLLDFVQMLEELAGGQANVVHKPRIAADVPYTFADISKARRLLGYDPKVSALEGVRQFWEWYRDNG